MNNRIDLRFPAKSENEALARLVISSFLAPLDPLVDELAEFKTALSEAVTNAIIHGYDEDELGVIEINAYLDGQQVQVDVRDNGHGIDNIDLAKEPLYSSKPLEERSGMGFTIMESFCDDVAISSTAGLGTVVTLIKQFTPTATFQKVN